MNNHGRSGRGASLCGWFLVISPVAILLLSLSTGAQAQTTHTVCPPGNPSAPCSYDSPGAALADNGTVMAGDTLDIQNDTYILPAQLVVDRSLTLNFNGSLVDADGDRGVLVISPATVATINDLVLINGLVVGAELGGGILVQDASLDLSGSRLESNTAQAAGGGLASVDATVNVTDTEFIRNSTDGQGAAVLSQGSSSVLTLTRVNVDQNWSRSPSFNGGAVTATSDGVINVVDSAIIRNASTDPILAVDNYGNPSLPGASCFSPTLGRAFVGQTFVATQETLTGFRFLNPVGNTGVVVNDIPVTGLVRSGGPTGPVIANATALIPQGTPSGTNLDLDFTLDAPIAVAVGATYAVEMDFPASRSFIVNSNNAYPDGAGYRCSETTGSFDLEFQIFGGISTVGGVYSEGTVDMLNVTLSDSVGVGAMAAQRSSGAPYRVNATLSTISNNQRTGLHGVVGVVSGVVTFEKSILAFNQGGQNCLGDSTSAVSLGYNVMRNDLNCGAIQAVGDQWGTPATPIDPLLGPLQNNGGPTFTRAIDPASPAVDSGLNDPTCGGTGTSTDQRGLARPQGAACDAGAFELQPSATPLQALIDAAAPGATIVVPDGVYTEGITIGDNKILQGSGPGNVVIDVTGLGVQGVVATGSFTLIGVRVTGADVNVQAGGINVGLSGLDVVLNNVRVDNNRSSFRGAGIFIENNSNLTATNLQVDDNIAGTDGGGIYFDGNNDVVLNDVQISSNSAGRDGGGIWSQGDVFLGSVGCGATPVVGTQSNIIEGNTALAGQGGGIYNQVSFTMTDTRISNNTALTGGGILNDGPVATFDIDCSVLDTNQAAGGSGGALSLAGGVVTLDQSLVQSNSADVDGGGIDVTSGTLDITTTEFVSNNAQSGGGAINYLVNGNVSQSIFRNNFSALGGGAVRAQQAIIGSVDNVFDANTTSSKGGAILMTGTFSLLNSTGDSFTDNSARDGGGAISSDSPGPSSHFIDLTDGLLTGNQVGEGGISVSGRGAAIEFVGTLASVQNSEFINNTAPESGDGLSQGGAIFTNATQEFTLADSTISGSSAGDGGAIYNEGIASVVGSTLTNNSVTDPNAEPRGGAIASTGTLSAVNSTISGNVVNPGPGNTGDGGALAVFGGGTATLNNMTLASNTAPDGGAVYAEPGQGALIFSNSVLAGNTGVIADCDQVISAGFNIYEVNPCPTQSASDLIADPLLGLLTDNGGLTETQTLLPGSPAQDAGAPAALNVAQFDNLTGFNVQGNAALDGNTLLIAGNETVGTVGSIYRVEPVDVSSNFSAQFDFQISPGSGGSSADGFTFTIGDDPTFLGDGGGSLGIGSRDDDGLPPYIPTGPLVSGVSVEFDTFVNGAAEGANDTGQEHVGINLDGLLASAALTDLGPAGTLSDGSVWTAWIDYDANSNLLEVRTDNSGARPALATVSLTVDILAEADADADGNVYVGFTGAAGAGNAVGGQHRILNFQFANGVACEATDQRGVIRPQGLRCDIGAVEADVIAPSINGATLSSTTSTTFPGVVDIPIVDIPIERLTGDTFNAPESAPLSSFPLSSFPLSSFDLRASPMSSFPLSSFPLSSFDIVGAPLSSFPLSSFPLSSLAGGWSAITAQIPELAGAPLQTVSLQQVLEAAPPSLLQDITLGSLDITDSPLSSLSLPGLALGDDNTVAVLDDWIANATPGAPSVCQSLAARGFTACSDSDTFVSLEVKGAPVASLPLSSLPLSSFPLSSFPLSSFPLSSFPLSSFPLSSFPLSSFPLSSFPLSSFPLSSFPLSSLDLLAAPLSSFPLSSFPLSSFPLSSFDVAGTPFCDFYDDIANSSGELTCAALGINPSVATLETLIAALAQAGNSSIGSTPLSSFPMSSFNIASLPLSSFDVTSAAVATSPISALTLGDFAGCQEIDGTSNCATVASLDSNSSLLDVANEYGSLAASPLSSFPLSSLPLSSLPMSSFPLSSFEINGAPLSSFPLSSFEILSSPLSSFPMSSFPLSSFDQVFTCAAPCSQFTTFGDAFLAGQVRSDARLSDVAESSRFAQTTFGDLLGSLSLQFLYGFEPSGAENLGEIADLGNLTFGQLLITLMLKSDFPWETIPLSQIKPQTFSADNVVGYDLAFALDGNLVDPITATVTLSDSFHFQSGSASFVTSPQAAPSPVSNRLADPQIVDNGNGTQSLIFTDLAPSAFTNNTLSIVAVPSLGIGTFDASAELALGAGAPTVADGNNATVSVVPSPQTDAPSFSLPALTQPDILLLGFVNSSGDSDYFQIPPPPKGSRVSVFMANPEGDNDLLLYRPASAVEPIGQNVEAAALPLVPYEDDGVLYEGNITEEPDTLDDINVAAAPLSSLSTNRGGLDEEVSAIGDGANPFTLQVSGYNGAVSTQPYTLRIKVTPEVPQAQCTPRPWPGSVGQPGAGDFSPAGQWTANTNAVFLVNWSRLAASDPGGVGAANDALNAVNALVNAPGMIDGVVIDVTDIPGVSYAAWDADPCDPSAANAVVNAITAYLENQRTGSPNLTYVTLVGSDEVIPFARKADETAIANESTFAGEFFDNAMFGTLVSRNFLSDDTYGDIDPIAWLDRYLNVPELAVGRLVESAVDIQLAADNYVSSGGELVALTGVSAGYDFVADSSDDIQDTFQTYGVDSTPLVDQPGISPSQAWDRSAFLTATGLDEVSTPVADLVSFNMHFDFDEALPSSGDASGNYSDNLISVQDFAGNDMTRRLWFTVGCHSGTSIADISVAQGDLSQDWAQTLSELGAVYVAQAAYGLGDTVALALTERLLANFARNLNGSITAGQAHAFAKQDYFRDLGLYGEYDYKALQASVYFGLPMYRVVTPTPVIEPLPPLRPVIADVQSGLNSTSIAFTPIITREASSKGDLFSVDGETQFVHYRPLQPIVGIDVTSDNGDIARGAFLTSLETEDLFVADMAFARPVIDLGILEPEIETDEVVFPTTFTNISSYRVPSSPEPFEDRQQLNVIVGQYTSPAGSTSGTQRLFRSFGAQVFYQPAITVQKNAAQKMALSDDDFRPRLNNIQASVLGQSGSFQATFSVDATDVVNANGSAGVVRRVAILYRKSVNSQGRGVWVLEDLVKGSGNTWTGGGPVDNSGLQSGQVDYIVQAVDANANVANSTFKGLFYVAEQLPPPPNPSGGNGTVGIVVTANGQPVSADDWINDNPVTVEVTNLSPGVSYEFSVDSPDFSPLNNPFINVFGDGLHVVTIREVDGANPVSIGVPIDTTSPGIFINSPAAGQFVEQGDGGSVSTYQCADSGSGTASCLGSVSSGQPIPASQIGSQDFTVTAQDFAGNPSTTVTNNYYVVKPIVLDSPAGPVELFEPVTVTGSATDLADFTESATIHWGDGTSDPLELTEDGGNLTFSAEHEYTLIDTFAITVVLDFGGAYVQSGETDIAVSGAIGLWAQHNSFGIVWSGSGGSVDGLNHSNGDIKISGAAKTINGRTRHKGELKLSGGNHVFSQPPEKVTRADWPLASELSDYRPGRALALSLGSQFFDMRRECNQNGQWELKNNTAPGLYWVPCKVVVKGSKVVANVTVVSNFDMEVTGSKHKITPFVDGLVFYTNLNSDTAIKISSSKSDFKGYIVARRGSIVMSGSNQTVGCGLLGQDIKLSGSNRIIGQDCALPTH